MSKDRLRDKMRAAAQAASAACMEVDRAYIGVQVGLGRDGKPSWATALEKIKAAQKELQRLRRAVQRREREARKGAS